MGTKKNIFTINQIKDAVKILEQSMANFFNSTLERIDKKNQWPDCRKHCIENKVAEIKKFIQFHTD